MTRRWAVYACTVMLGFAPAIASAAPLIGASFTIRSDDLAIPPAVFVAGGATGAASSPTAATLGAGPAFVGQATRDFAGLDLFDGIELEVLPNQAGSFTGSPLSGTAIFDATGTLLLGSAEWTELPLRFGQAFKVGVAIEMPTAKAQLPLTLSGQAWAEQSNEFTPAGGGTLQLVAPLRITSPFIDEFEPVIFAELDLQFAPEPGSALLLGWGVACLTIAGRRRARRG